MSKQISSRDITRNRRGQSQVDRDFTMENVGEPENSVESEGEGPTIGKRLKMSSASQDEDGQDQEEHSDNSSFPIIWSVHSGEAEDCDYGDTEDDLDGESLRTLGGVSGREFWTSPDAEEELCRLWEEFSHLYDSGHPEHRDPTARKVSLKKIANALKIPVKFINVRMQSLRTSFQKLVKEDPSGSLPRKLTYRQNRILKLCSFLHGHVKTTVTETQSIPLKKANQSIDSRSPERIKRRKGRPSSHKEHHEVYAPEISAAPIQQADLFGTEYSADDFGEEEDSKQWYNGANVATNHNETNPNVTNSMGVVLQDWSRMLESLTRNVAVLSDAAARSQIDIPETTESLWAKSLVPQMFKMNQKTRNRFMMHVYQLTFDAVEGNWPSSSK